MLALFTILFITGIIAGIIAIALIPFASSSDENGKHILLVVLIYVGGVLLANACFWSTILYFVIKLLKNVL